MVSKLVSKLAIKVLGTNILDSKLVSKKLIETVFFVRNRWNTLSLCLGI